MAAELKYRAFISYSHNDKKWADWLHGTLENYRVPKPLLDAPGRDGPIPRKLFPIYRDRAETPATADLQDYVRNALEQSAYLIVICSPSARQSKWVNQEILTFKKLGRESRILGLIVEGEPTAHDRLNDCFPRAMRFRIGPTGELSQESIEPAAADARPHGDGKENAKTKLIAGLLGVDYGVLKQRELQAAKRRGRIYQAIAAGMFGLALLATGGGFLAYHYALRSEAMAEKAVAVAASFVDQTVALSNRFGVTQSTINGFLVSADQQLAQLYEDGIRTPSLERQRAKILLLFADHYVVTGDTIRARARAQEAVGLSRDLVRQFPSNPQDRLALAAAEGKLGDVLVDQGAYGDALTNYQASLQAISSLSGTDPTNLEWLRLQARRLSDMGWAYEKRGELPNALEAYQTALRIRTKVALKSASIQAQHDISASEQNIGTILQKEGKLDEALSQFQASELIAHRIAVLDPTNSKWQFDDATSDENIGEVLEIQGDLDHALVAFRTSLAVRQRLAASDPENADWQAHVASSYLRIGDVLRMKDSRTAAIAAYTDAISILARLTSIGGGNSDWPRDLYVLKSKIADVLKASGNLDGALAAYRSSLLRAEALAETDPSNAEWQDDLATLEYDIGDILIVQGKLQEGIGAYRKAENIIRHLKPDVLATEEIQNDLAHTEAGIGLGLVGENELDAGRKDLSNALDIRRRLILVDPKNAALLHDAAINNFELARVEMRLRLAGLAKTHIREARADLQRAIRMIATKPQWNQELAEITRFEGTPVLSQ